jgi:anti-sigma B factor antagonist
MAETATKAVYLVDAESDPVVIRIDGRAAFQNSGCLRDFVTEMLRQGRKRFVLDFQQCTGVDSTFLGVLAGAAIELKKSPGGSLVAARVGQRNLDLMRNLGLHRLVTIDPASSAGTEQCRTGLESAPKSEVETARMVLEAHENLVKADESNRAKFKDVLTFLRSKTEPKS